MFAEISADRSLARCIPVQERHNAWYLQLSYSQDNKRVLRLEWKSLHAAF